MPLPFRNRDSMPLKAVVLLCLPVLLLSSCALGYSFPFFAPSPSNTPSLTHTSTATLTPTSTPTPTNSPTPTPTQTPTITLTPTSTATPTNSPTPTSTSIAGGAGFVIGTCQNVTSQIYALDLTSEEYRPVHNLSHTPSLWESDYVIQLSPTRDRVIWGHTLYRDVETGWQHGEETVTGFASQSSQTYISPADFSEEGVPYHGEMPNLWLPGDVGLFFEDDLSQEYQSNLGFTMYPVRVYVGDIRGSNKRFLAEYKRVNWQNPGDVALSPNGKYFAFTAVRDDPDDEYWDAGYVAVVDLVSKTLREYPFYSFGDINWSPDSSRFILTGKILDEEENTYWGAIFLFDVSEGQFHLLRERSLAQWSPDGEWLAGYDNSAKTAFLIRLDGSDFQPINLPEGSTRWGVDELQWTPDGAGLYIVSTARYDSQDIRHLLYYDFATGQAVLIQEFSDWSFIGGKRIFPSPDGKWVILRSFFRDRRFTQFMAIGRSWHVCGIQGCLPFTPPDTTECYNVEWVGPYALRGLSSPFIQ